MPLAWILSCFEFRTVKKRKGQGQAVSYGLLIGWEPFPTQIPRGWQTASTLNITTKIICLVKYCCQHFTAWDISRAFPNYWSIYQGLCCCSCNITHESSAWVSVLALISSNVFFLNILKYFENHADRKYSQALSQRIRTWKYSNSL